MLHLYLLLIPRDWKKGFREESKSNGKTTRWLMQSHSQSQRNMAINDGLLITEHIMSIGSHLAAITWKRCKEKRRRNYACMGNRVNYSLVLMASKTLYLIPIWFWFVCMLVLFINFMLLFNLLSETYSNNATELPQNPALISLSIMQDNEFFIWILL